MSSWQTANLCRATDPIRITDHQVAQIAGKGSMTVFVGQIAANCCRVRCFYYGFTTIGAIYRIKCAFELQCMAYHANVFFNVFMPWAEVPREEHEHAFCSKSRQNVAENIYFTTILLQYLQYAVIINMRYMKKLITIICVKQK